MKILPESQEVVLSFSQFMMSERTEDDRVLVLTFVLKGADADAFEAYLEGQIRLQGPPPADPEANGDGPLD